MSTLHVDLPKKNKIFYLIFLLLIVIAMFLQGCKKPVNIKIITIPEKATILINGEQTIGETPLQFEWNFKPQTIVIQKEGYYTISQEININWFQTQYRMGKIQNDKENRLVTLVYTLNSK